MQEFHAVEDNESHAAAVDVRFGGSIELGWILFVLWQNSRRQARASGFTSATATAKVTVAEG
jgi:hypothetical protein